jgi:isopenicillin N synthase-like dioxygenase
MAKIASIPVIDISGEGDQTQVAKDLVEAAIEHGFIYIKNLGKDIPVEAIEGAFEMVFGTCFFCMERGFSQAT